MKKRRNWKTLRPNSTQAAIKLCLEYADAKFNRSIDNVADLTGTTNWAIYKWMANNSMPSQMIRPFEHACGIDYVTQYLAASGGKLLIEIPRGVRVKDDQVLALQTNFNEAINLLANFYKSKAGPDDTVAALMSVMSQLAGHRENVSKYDAPELALSLEADE